MSIESTFLSKMIGKFKKLIKRILFMKITKPKIYPLIRKYATNKSTLEVGGGASPHKEYFPNSVSIDLSKTSKADIIADAHNLPFVDESFKVILITETLEHIYNPFIAVEEIYRVLERNGIVVLSVPFVFPIHEAPKDYFRFTLYGLRELFKEFEEIEIIPVFNMNYSLAIIIQRCSFQATKSYQRVLYAILSKFFVLFGNTPQLTYGDIGRHTIIDNFSTSNYFCVFERLT